MLEFTGERLIPGKVAPELWNEHYSRYRFACRLAQGKRVLDVACGAGYGSAEMARTAALVVGLDVAHDAVAAARGNYHETNQRYVTASAEAIPFKDSSFDLIVAYEVIEHLEGWFKLVTEARRLLTDRGRFVVSTPNRAYYTETRKDVGPNPFHVHEFDFEEFEQALKESFPSVQIFTQNHVGGIAFSSAHVRSQESTALEVDGDQPDPNHAHYFVAVCSYTPAEAVPDLIYIPSTGNILEERGLHISKLEAELSTKDEWLEKLKADHSRLAELHTRQMHESEKAQRWALSLNAELKALGERLLKLQTEHDEAMRSYQTRVEELDEELKTRTLWALDLQTSLGIAERKLTAVQTSRWVRLGRKLSVGPDLEAGNPSGTARQS